MYLLVLGARPSPAKLREAQMLNVPYVVGKQGFTDFLENGEVREHEPVPPEWWAAAGVADQAEYIATYGESEIKNTA